MTITRTEEIRGAIANMGEEALADALALLLGEGQSNTGAGASGTPEFENFAQAIHWLKRHCGFPELALFSTEADLVYVSTDDRRILLTDRDSIRQFPARMPGGAAFSGGASGTDPRADDNQETTRATTDRPDDGVATADRGETGRFSHLEL